VNTSSGNYKSLVNLFKGCGQSPQILSFAQSNDSRTAYCLAAWTQRRKPLKMLTARPKSSCCFLC